MSDQVLHLLERGAALDGPGCEGVAQVVKAEVLQLGTRYGALEGVPVCVPVTAEDAPVRMGTATSEHGVVPSGERGAYRLAQALDNVQVPATVQAILASRIDRLPAAQKQLLQSAAVIGKDIPFVLLHAVTDQAEDGVRRHLALLQSAEFLYETRVFPESEYTFKHVLTQEVAYGGLLNDRRRAIHGRIVEAIERLQGDRLAEQVERLAHHALRAELWEKALSGCSGAG